MKKSFIVLLCLCACIMIAGCGTKEKETDKQQEDIIIEPDASWTGAIEVSEPHPDSYVIETDYSGNVPAAIYDYPFAKSGYYVMNKDLDITNETSERLEAYVDEYMNIMLGTGYRTIQDDIQKYNDKVSQVCSPVSLITTTDGAVHNMQDFLHDIADFIIDNHIVIDTAYNSDHSLIYSDGITYIRGELDITIYECDDISVLSEQLKLFFPDVETFEKGVTYSFVVDTSIISDEETYQILDTVIIARMQ